MTTDPTPRDVNGEPLVVGRWYWVRRCDDNSDLSCVRVDSIRGVGSGYVSVECSDAYRTRHADLWEFQPADGPPAWPEVSDA